MPMWSIAYGREAEHAAALRIGLDRLGPGFAARVCGVCAGEGRCVQTFTAGCGGGYFQTNAGCDWCDGTGLLQGDRPAPASVRAQVIEKALQDPPAARRRPEGAVA